MIKILNLYAGIGGNRKLWPDEEIEVTAVENNESIAAIYKDFFPQDTVIVADAHQYLLEHFQEFDFIWSSPPCQSHSRLRKCSMVKRGHKPIYPDMKLYQEIIFLKYHHKGTWVVENVNSYYKPLILPQLVHRHYFWANFPIPKIRLCIDSIEFGNLEIWQNKLGMDISNYKLTHRKDQVLKNCVNPKLGLHVFNCAFKEKQKTLT